MGKKGGGNDARKAALAALASRDQETKQEPGAAPAAQVGFASCDRPAPRCHFSLTEVAPGRLLLFGGEIFNGRKFTCFQDIYELRLSETMQPAWRKLGLGSRTAPKARSAHQALAWQGSLYVLGGEWADSTQETVRQFDDIWRLDVSEVDDASWSDVSAAKGFSQRSGHRACLHDGNIVVFGGYMDTPDGGTKYLNDVHRFDLKLSKFRKGEEFLGAKPCGRSAGQVWSDGQAVWAYGGSTPAPKQKGVKDHMDALGDLWRLETGKWLGPSAVAGTSPGGRSGIASAPVPSQAHLRLFFGGVTDRFGQKKEEFSAFHNDAWMLDTKALTWTQLDLQPGVLQGRIGAQLAPMSVPGGAGALILFGGVAEAGPREITMDDLWCVSEEVAEANVPAQRQWKCLLPLSAKTRTWFPDNDADSSDDEEGDGESKELSKSAKKREKKNSKKLSSKDENTTASEAVDGKEKAGDTHGDEVQDQEESKTAKKKKKRQSKKKDNDLDDVDEEEDNGKSTNAGLTESSPEFAPKPRTSDEVTSKETQGM